LALRPSRRGWGGWVVGGGGGWAVHDGGPQDKRKRGFPRESRAKTLWGKSRATKNKGENRGCKGRRYFSKKKQLSLLKARSRGDRQNQSPPPANLPMPERGRTRKALEADEKGKRQTVGSRRHGEEHGHPRLKNTSELDREHLRPDSSTARE